jgi:hypothetical protein
MSSKASRGRRPRGRAICATCATRRRIARRSGIGSGRTAIQRCGEARNSSHRPLGDRGADPKAVATATGRDSVGDVMQGQDALHPVKARDPDGGGDDRPTGYQSGARRQEGEFALSHRVCRSRGTERPTGRPLAQLRPEARDQAPLGLGAGEPSCREAESAIGVGEVVRSIRGRALAGAEEQPLQRGRCRECGQAAFAFQDQAKGRKALLQGLQVSRGRGRPDRPRRSAKRGIGAGIGGRRRRHRLDLRPIGKLDVAVEEAVRVRVARLQREAEGRKISLRLRQIAHGEGNVTSCAAARRGARHAKRSATSSR